MCRQSDSPHPRILYPSQSPRTRWLVILALATTLLLQVSCKQSNSSSINTDPITNSDVAVAAMELQMGGLRLHLNPFNQSQTSDGRIASVFEVSLANESAEALDAIEIELSAAAPDIDISQGFAFWPTVSGNGIDAPSADHIVILHEASAELSPTDLSFVARQYESAADPTLTGIDGAQVGEVPNLTSGQTVTLIGEAFRRGTDFLVDITQPTGTDRFVKLHGRFISAQRVEIIVPFNLTEVPEASDTPTDYIVDPLPDGSKIWIDLASPSPESVSIVVNVVNDVQIPSSGQLSQQLDELAVDFAAIEPDFEKIAANIPTLNDADREAIKSAAVSANMAIKLLPALLDGLKGKGTISLLEAGLTAQSTASAKPENLPASGLSSSLSPLASSLTTSAESCDSIDPTDPAVPAEQWLNGRKCKMSKIAAIQDKLDRLDRACYLVNLSAVILATEPGLNVALARASQICDVATKNNSLIKILNDLIIVSGAGQILGLEMSVRVFDSEQHERLDCPECPLSEIRLKKGDFAKVEVSLYTTSKVDSSVLGLRLGSVTGGLLSALKKIRNPVEPATGLLDSLELVKSTWELLLQGPQSLGSETGRVVRTGLPFGYLERKVFDSGCINAFGFGNTPGGIIIDDSSAPPSIVSSHDDAHYSDKDREFECEMRLQHDLLVLEDEEDHVVIPVTFVLLGDDASLTCELTSKAYTQNVVGAPEDVDIKSGCTTDSPFIIETSAFSDNNFPDQDLIIEAKSQGSAGANSLALSCDSTIQETIDFVPHRDTRALCDVSVKYQASRVTFSDLLLPPGISLTESGMYLDIDASIDAQPTRDSFAEDASVKVIVTIRTADGDSHVTQGSADLSVLRSETPDTAFDDIFSGLSPPSLSGRYLIASRADLEAIGIKDATNYFFVDLDVIIYTHAYNFYGNFRPAGFARVNFKL